MQRINSKEDLDITLEAEQSDFDKIYWAAVLHEGYTIRSLMESGVAVRFVMRNHDTETPTSLLAFEGSDNAVEFLLRNNFSDADWALHGYARANNKAKVAEFLERGCDIDWAVTGYAFGNHVEEVNELLAQGANLEAAAIGYAASGNYQQVRNLLNANPGLDRTVPLAWLVSAGGCIEGANSLIDSRLDNSAFAASFAKCDRFKTVDQVVYVLAITKDSNLRQFIAIEGEKVLRGQLPQDLSTEQLYALGTRIHKIMHDYNFNYAQARGLTIQGARAWLIQAGPALYRGEGFSRDDGQPLPILPRDIKDYISSFVLGISIEQVEQVRSAVNIKLWLDVVSPVYKQEKQERKAGCKFTLFGRSRGLDKEREKLLDKADQRHDNRMNETKQQP